MESKLEGLLQKVEYLRAQLLELGETVSLTDPRMVAISQELDKAILQVQKLMQED